MSIRIKLVIIFMVITAIPLLLTGTLSYYNARHFLMQATLKNLRDIADGKEAEILSFLRNGKARAIDFASDGFIRGQVEKILKAEDTVERRTLSAGLSRYLKIDKQLLDADIVEIDILDSKGDIIAATHDEDLGQRLELYRHKSYTIARFHDAEIIHRRPMISVEATIVDSSQKDIIAVLLVRYDIGRIRDIISGETSFQSGAKTTLDISGRFGIYLVNKDGYVIISYNKMEELGFLGKKIETEPVRKYLEGNEELSGIWLDYRGIPVTGSSMCINTGDFRWALIAEQDASEALAPVNRLRLLMSFIVIITLCFVYFVAVRIAKSITGPIKALTESADKISKGEIDVKLDIKSKDEIGALAKSFERMLTAIKIFKEDKE